MTDREREAYEMGLRHGRVEYALLATAARDVLDIADQHSDVEDCEPSEDGPGVRPNDWMRVETILKPVLQAIAPSANAPTGAEEK